MNEINIFVNGEKFPLDSDRVKVGVLIELGKGNKEEYELQKRQDSKGPVIKTYKDPEEIVTVKNDDYFTTRFTGAINPA